jgi:hypothetical protein
LANFIKKIKLIIYVSYHPSFKLNNSQNGSHKIITVKIKPHKVTGNPGALITNHLVIGDKARIIPSGVGAT